MRGNSREIGRAEMENHSSIKIRWWLCWQVFGERLSGFKFPVKRENTGKFRRSSREGGKTARFSDSNSAGYVKIPYAPEQGIFLEPTGNCFPHSREVAWLNLQRMEFSERTPPFPITVCAFAKGCG